MTRTVVLFALLLAAGPFVLAQGIPIDVPEVSVDPRVDGAASFVGEWTEALVFPDSFVDPFTGVTPAGFLYYQKRTNWTATSSTGAMATYPGPTLFIAHDIFGDVAGSFAGFRANDAGDWNYASARRPSGALVECWCFGGFSVSPTPPHVPPTDLNEPDDGLWLGDAAGLGASSLIPEGAGTDLIDDRGFIVRLNGDPTTDRHWFPGDPEPGDAGWSWDAYYGCFARAGFNSTFFDTGPDPDPAHSSRNEVYEWCFHGATGLEPPLDCTRWKIVWVDPPKRAIIFIAPNWWIHFGPPPVPALAWPWMLGLCLVLAAGGYLVLTRRRRAALLVVPAAIVALVLAGCGGGGGQPPPQQKLPPPFRLPPLVPHNALGRQPYPVPPVVGTRPPLQVPVDGGTPPFQFSLVAGSLPHGVVLETDGRIHSNGLALTNPAAPVTFDFTYEVMDGTGASLQAESSIHLDPDPFTVPIELVSLSLQSVSPIAVGKVGEEMWAITQVRGGNPAFGYQFQVSPTTPNPLPAGLNLSPSGVVRGFPMAPTAGPIPVEFLVQNGPGGNPVLVQFDIAP